MNKFTYHVLLTSVLLALSVGANAEAKAAPTRLTTDPAITEKAIAAQMNQVNSENNVNFNNMLLQKNLGDSIAETAAPKASALDIDLRGAVTLAIQNNRDITIAELQRREAEADVSAAAAGKIRHSRIHGAHPEQKPKDRLAAMESITALATG